MVTHHLHLHHPTPSFTKSDRATNHSSSFCHHHHISLQAHPLIISSAQYHSRQWLPTRHTTKQCTRQRNIAGELRLLLQIARSCFWKSPDLRDRLHEIFAIAFVFRCILAIPLSKPDHRDCFRKLRHHLSCFCDLQNLCNCFCESPQDVPLMFLWLRFWRNLCLLPGTTYCHDVSLLCCCTHQC